ncbi:transposase [Thermotalea metallivorans]|uniref:Transposase n=1 Tax=Thermotalea metallivorans TaxID=520762 RepID=A0A140KZB0_9FIRM|nr:transposase [Thermotalea metallivorans]KXG73635.1 hypothetical protein AN619_30290 [Thermotalea metallivorans]
MSKTRRKYSKEFKEKVIKEAMETGNAALVARQYDLNKNMLNRWVREFKNPKKQPTVNQEYKDHTAAMRMLESENETLKKLLGDKDLKIAILEDLLKKTTHR